LFFGFVFLLYTPLYWVIFHYGLNILRRKSFFYLGRNSIDRFLLSVDHIIGRKPRTVIHFILALLTSATATWINLG
jgi:hypothetical protein